MLAAFRARCGGFRTLTKQTGHKINILSCERCWIVRWLLFVFDSCRGVIVRGLRFLSLLYQDCGPHWHLSRAGLFCYSHDSPALPCNLVGNCLRISLLITTYWWEETNAVDEFMFNLECALLTKHRTCRASEWVDYYFHRRRRTG